MLLSAIRQAAAAGVAVAFRAHPKTGALELCVFDAAPAVGGRAHARTWPAALLELATVDHYGAKQLEQELAAHIDTTAAYLNPQAARAREGAAR